MGTMFVDAETDGLYGDFLSVAAIVLDENGEESGLFYGMIRNPEQHIKSEWVKENVLPYLDNSIRSGEDIYDDPDRLIEAFYSFYLTHKDNYVIADVPCPVEARLFSRAVQNDLKSREFEAPFPLMDLSSMLYLSGYPPLIERSSLVDCSDLQIHNSLDDVRMSIRVWKKIKGEDR